MWRPQAKGGAALLAQLRGDLEALQKDLAALSFTPPARPAAGGCVSGADLP